jgi:hypothetical protein
MTDTRTIVVEPCGNGNWKAYLLDDPKQWAWDRTQLTAVGRLLAGMAHELGFTVTDLDRPDWTL